MKMLTRRKGNGCSIQSTFAFRGNADWRAKSLVVAIGLALDRILPLASLPVSLSLFFVVLALGWPLAVRWTEPKHAKNVKLAS